MNNRSLIWLLVSQVLFLAGAHAAAGSRGFHGHGPAFRGGESGRGFSRRADRLFEGETALIHAAAPTLGDPLERVRELDREVVNAYVSAGGDRRIPERLGSDFPFGFLISSLLVRDTFNHEDPAYAVSATADFLGLPPAPETYALLFSILKMADRTDPPSRELVEAAARLQAFNDFQLLRIGRKEKRSFPVNPWNKGPLVDLAAGINSSDLSWFSLEDGVDLHLVDSSPLVAGYLREFSSLLQADGRPGAERLHVVEQDLLTLKKPSIALGAIRAKNVNSYVPGAPRKIAEMVDWLGPGGQLHLQTDVSFEQRRSMFLDYRELAERLLSSGWSFEIKVADQREHLALDRITLTKPGDFQAKEGSWTDVIGAFVEDNARIILATAPRLAGEIGRISRALEAYLQDPDANGPATVFRTSD